MVRDMKFTQPTLPMVADPTLIEDLDIPTRAKKAYLKAGITNLTDFLSMCTIQDGEITFIPEPKGIGFAMQEEVKFALVRRGYKVRGGYETVYHDDLVYACACISGCTSWDCPGDDGKTDHCAGCAHRRVKPDVDVAVEIEEATWD